MSVGGVDHEYIHTRFDECACSASHITVNADRSGERERTIGARVRTVDRATHRGAAGDSADNVATLSHQREIVARCLERLECSLTVGDGVGIE